MSRLRKLAVQCSGIGLLLLAAATRGCGSEEPAGQTGQLPEAGQPEGSAGCPQLDSSIDRAPDAVPETSGSEAGPCPGTARPPQVPEGWIAHDGWSCACGLYVPTSPDQLPEAIEWEPCPPAAPEGLECERMKATWTTDGRMIARPVFGIDPDSGAAQLMYVRMNAGDDPSLRYQVVAEADGPVRQAMMQVLENTMGCSVWMESLNQNRYAMNVLGKTAGEGFGEGEAVIASTVGDLAHPVKLSRPNEGDAGGSSSWHVSSDWLIELQSNATIYSWDLSAKHIPYAASDDPDHMAYPGITAFGQDVFYEFSVNGYAGVMSWNPAQGLRPLLRWFNDWTRGAGNFGTDGKDMVWTYGEGKPPTTTPYYPVLNVMTAPYTTDPAEAQGKARRIRSDLCEITVHPWAVGCGYAARYLNCKATSPLFIVRLSDGYSWIVEGVPFDPEGPPDTRFAISHPIGMTCNHLYFLGGSGRYSTTVMRLGLDSLGPGQPPD